MSPDSSQTTIAEQSSRWARRFVFTGVCFLVCWQVVVVAGFARRTGVVLGLLGFVFHTVFGKAYSLVPSYFDRDLVSARFMAPQLALSASGTTLLAAGIESGTETLRTAGSALWALGVVVFLGTILWTVRDNLSGGETATGDANADRRDVDRLANLFVPVALAYLAVGSYDLLAVYSSLPPVFDGYPPRAIHLLAAGTATVLVFAIGFRLLPRFFVATPPRPLVWVVLPTGAVAPLVLASSLPAGRWFAVGAALEALAVAGFATAVGILSHRSDRRRVGFDGVLAGAVAGLCGVALGLVFAFEGITAARIAAHLRLNLLGFLGLTIVGVSYQFYPPAVGTFPGAGDGTARVAIGLLAGGLLVEAAAGLADVSVAVTAGRVATLAGASVHAYLLGGLFRERFGGG
jgi:hypothetical protein